MIPRQPVYIAGPYAGPSVEAVALNCARAALLGQHAVREGMAPMVPHLQGAAAIYGESRDDGSPSAARDAAIECSVTWARLVGAGGGAFWAIEVPGVVYTAGVALEYEAWLDGGGDVRRRVSLTWEQWEQRIAAKAAGRTA